MLFEDIGAIQANMQENEVIEQLRQWRDNSETKRGMLPMPSSVYVDEGFAKLENSRIFRDEWVCVGHAHELAEKGSYLTFDLLEQPLLIVRNLDDELRAFSNVCPHRSARIAEGRGRTRLLVCPYHAWSYDLDGNLKSAPYMEPEQVKDICLRTIRLESWVGMLFVNLDGHAEPQPHDPRRKNPVGLGCTDFARHYFRYLIDFYSFRYLDVSVP